MRKPNARSVLKTLPSDRQRLLYDYLGEHTLEEAEAWLALDGVNTGRSALSDFFAWYPLASKLQSASAMGNAVKDILRELPGLKLDEHQLSKAGQAIFEAQALKAGDSKLYLSLRSLRQMDRSLDLQEVSGKTKARQKDKQLAQKDRDLKLAERRVELLERNAIQAKAELTKVMEKGGLSQEALKQIEQAAKILS